VSKWPATEAELAEPVVAWIADMGWTVYQEVMLSPGDTRRADIVATSGRIVWVIEVKRSLSLDLLAQGLDWKPWAHRVSLAYPAARVSRARQYAALAARSDGLGLLAVQGPVFTYQAAIVREVSGPKLNRRPLEGLRAALCEEHKTFAAAGSADGHYWSPFRATCEVILAAVQASPGLTVREVIDRVDHHYKTPASARGSVYRWASEGKIPGVEVRRDGAARLYPTEAE
jgi:hypothetical protein